ncbi:hypothetical protein BaRGS_00027094 [Batillaria attramentaria]|uniref:Scavenger receptor class B member 1 n=1 Tax=Batillaria attramentaria TaxID=370345 RepID=A0ABD0K3X0_9CAEN
MVSLSRRSLCVVFGVGVVLLAGGGIMIPVVNMLVKDKIKQTVIISNTSELYDVWSEPPLPIYMQFYMFNLSNPAEVKQGKKPFLVQRGPYTYREHRKKYDITFNENGTVTYRQKRTFFFEREMSVGDVETDLIVTANPPVLAVIEAMQHAPPALRTLVSIALRTQQEDIFMTHTVNETLFGYTDPALKILQSQFPDWFYTDYVGYFINKNDTDDGLYTVFTGKNDISNLGQIDMYNGSRYVSYWTTPWANMINGSDGTISPPFEHDTKQAPMFSSDVCRSVFGVYSEDVKTTQGIPLRRFLGSPLELANVTENPDNIGFCTPDETKCLPSGLLNISNCQIVDYFKIPVVVSFPHFYLADPTVQDSVGGLHPVAEEHQTAVDLEPWTGLVLRAFKRLQINMYLTNVQGFSQTANVPTVFLPIFWMNESAVVDDKHATMLQRQLFVPLEVTAVLEKVFMIVGGVLVVFVFGMSCRQRYTRFKQTALPPGPIPSTSSISFAPPRMRNGERMPLLRERGNEQPPPPPPARNLPTVPPPTSARNQSEA